MEGKKSLRSTKKQAHDLSVFFIKKADQNRQGNDGSWPITIQVRPDCPPQNESNVNEQSRTRDNHDVVPHRAAAKTLSQLIHFGLLNSFLDAIPRIVSCVLLRYDAWQ
mmetsp:Transcript_471/g.1020  ORF Transcript_471/g.1020 Transcript_471/m.1020 type:complete len:108 (-) Transcript_471:249-572(-)|eukprot:scaffold8728_cov164-Amphora_coffeaeformis.AAC.13